MVVGMTCTQLIALKDEADMSDKELASALNCGIDTVERYCSGRMVLGFDKSVTVYSILAERIYKLDKEFAKKENEMDDD